MKSMSYENKTRKNVLGVCIEWFETPEQLNENKNPELSKSLSRFGRTTLPERVLRMSASSGLPSGSSFASGSFGFSSGFALASCSLETSLPEKSGLDKRS